MALKKKQAATPNEDTPFLPNTLRIADLAAEKKAKDIKAYDVRGLTLVADAFVICTATSEPQLKAVYNSVRDGLAEIGVKPYRSEGSFGGGWLLLDFGDIICHIFREEARAFYDLDGMWADAKEIPLDLEPAVAQEPA